MWYALYYLSSLFYFRCYLVTLMAPSLYLLLDIVYSLISTPLYSHVYKPPVFRESNLKFNLIVNNYLVLCFTLHSSATIVSNTSSKSTSKT